MFFSEFTGSPARKYIQTDGCLLSEHDGFKEDAVIENYFEEGRFIIFQILRSVLDFCFSVRTITITYLDGQLNKLSLLSFLLIAFCLVFTNKYLGKMSKKNLTNIFIDLKVYYLILLKIHSGITNVYA